LVSFPVVAPGRGPTMWEGARAAPPIRPMWYDRSCVFCWTATITWGLTGGHRGVTPSTSRTPSAGPKEPECRKVTVQRGSRSSGGRTDGVAEGVLNILTV